MVEYWIEVFDFVVLFFFIMESFGVGNWLVVFGGCILLFLVMLRFYWEKGLGGIFF